MTDGTAVRILCLRLSLALSALFVLAPALRAAADDDALWRRLARIERAFEGGDAGALRGCLSERSKVRIDVPILTDGPAAYGSGQLQVIFDRMFESTRTREFAFARHDVSVWSAGTAYARGRWVHRARGERTERVEHLTFTLREEAGDWRIQEIRASR